jgi:hypothetical protein
MTFHCGRSQTCHELFLSHGQRNWINYDQIGIAAHGKDDGLHPTCVIQHPWYALQFPWFGFSQCDHSHQLCNGRQRGCGQVCNLGALVVVKGVVDHGAEYMIIYDGWTNGVFGINRRNLTTVMSGVIIYF